MRSQSLQSSTRATAVLALSVARTMLTLRERQGHLGLAGLQRGSRGGLFGQGGGRASSGGGRADPVNLRLTLMDRDFDEAFLWASKSTELVVASSKKRRKS